MAAMPETIDQGMLEKLGVRRGSVRIWPKLETLVGFLTGLGIDHFEVDASKFDPNAKTTRVRRDSSERMREAHQAAAYDKWFREQVQEALDDPRPPISSEEVERRMDAKKAALRKKLAA